MNRETYSLLEHYMISCMEDSAHDKEHIYRVLYNALEIAGSEQQVDYDILITACLLHDIGRKEQFEDPQVCHAMAGGQKAYQFLMDHGFGADFASQVKRCIETHRFRKSNPPQSIEAKILFDADKLDVAGAIGIARTLIYKGQVAEPLYSMRPDGTVSDGDGDDTPSFFQEYKYKLEHLYEHFYTKKGAEMAGMRKQAAVDFYNSIYREVSSSYVSGKSELEKFIDISGLDVDVPDSEETDSRNEAANAKEHESLKLFHKFLKKFPPEQSLEKPNEELLATYEGRVPGELLEFWSQYGFGNYGGGMIKVINPAEYAESLYTWLGREDETKVPIMMDAFGDLFFYRKLSETEDDVCFLDIHYRNISLCAYSFQSFMDWYLDADETVEEFLNSGLYEEAVKKLGELKKGEIFYFSPALMAGGEESAECLKKGDGKVYHQVLFQLGQ